MLLIFCFFALPTLLWCLDTTLDDLKSTNTALCLHTGSNCHVSIANRTIRQDSIFPYEIPYGTTQSCDIFGPTCQPGFITLSSTGRDSRLTLATLPCSSYLSSQKSFVNGIAPDDTTAKVPEWDAIFGRSPECWSFADIHLSLNVSSFTWTYSQCENRKTVYTVGLTDPRRGLKMPAAFPPRVVRGKDIIVDLPCCAGCAINAADIRLYYFRDQAAIDYCHSQGRKVVVPSEMLNGTANITRASESFATHAVSLPPNESIAVVSGHTLTSPSFYLQFMGTVSVYDGCGQIGSVSTSPFIAIAPEHLSTVYFPNFTVGQEFLFDQATMFDKGGGTSKALNIADVECPTFGLGKSTAEDGEMHFTVGPPWLPMIVRPEEVLFHDPVWSSSCRWIPDGWWNVESAALYDPPRALYPGEGLVPDPTHPVPADPTAVDPVSSHPVVQPAQSVKVDQPAQTGGSDGSFKAGPAQSSEQTHENGDTDPGADTQQSTDPDRPGDQVNSINALPSKEKDQDTDTDSDVNGSQPHDSVPPKEANSQTQDPSIGDAIMQGFGNGSPKASDSPPVDPPGENVPAPEQHSDGAPQSNEAQPLTVGDQVFTPDPLGFQIAGTSIRPGSTAITVSGTAISLAPSGTLIVGDKTFVAANPNPHLSVSDQTFTANPSGFLIGKSSLLPGAPALMVAGTPISLGSSGVLAMGSRTVVIPSTVGAFYPVLTAGSHKFTANPTGFPIAGMYIWPDGPSVTVSGTRVALEASGVLVVGNQTFLLSPPSAFETAAADKDPVTVAGQTGTPNLNKFVVNGSNGSGRADVQGFEGNAKTLGVEWRIAIAAMGVWAVWIFNRGNLFQK